MLMRPNYRVFCALSLLAVAAVACDSLTSVTATDVVQPSSLENATGAQALRLGAIARFYYTESQLSTAGGLLADEFIAGFFNSNEDKRLLATQPTTLTTLGSAVWTNGNAARVDALLAIDALRKYSPTPAANVGQMFAIVGYTELFFGENLCSPVPLGETSPGSLVYGMPIDRDSMFRRAAAHFDTALALSTEIGRASCRERV